MKMRFEIRDSRFGRPGRLSLLAIVLFHSLRPAVSCALLLGTLALVTRPAAGDARGWTGWRGPTCSGAGVDTGKPLAVSFEEAKILWLSEEPTPGTYEGDSRKPVPRLKARIPAGYSSPIVIDNRVYLAYYIPNGPVFDRSVCSRHVDGGGVGREQWFTDADDVILCVDAHTGKTIWKRVYVEASWNLEGGFNKGGCQLTPCYQDGKIYAVGPSAHVYCVDAKTGDPVWTADMGIRARYQDALADGSRETGQVFGGRNDFAGCPIVAGGVLAVSDHQEYKCGPRGIPTGGNGLIGFDANTGKRLWWAASLGGASMLASSPLRWVHKGKEYFIASGNIGIACLEPATGRILWQLKDAKLDNAAVCNETHMWVQGSSQDVGLVCYEITPAGARLAWKKGESMGFTSPVLYKGHLYASLTDKGIVILEATTGKQVGTLEHPGTTGSMAAGDGRLFIHKDQRGKAGLHVYAIDGADSSDLGVWPVSFANSTSPAYYDGRCFVRGRDRLVCVDLRK